MPTDLRTRKPPKVVLAYMPWATTIRPSLALGILSAICREEDVAVKMLSPNMDMCATIGFEAASKLADQRALYGMSEHLFACDLFGADALSSEQYLDVLLTLELPAPFKNDGYIRHLRDHVIPEFLDRVTAQILAQDPTVVGFSATFNQVMASLAVARRLKKARPELLTIVGGACFDGEMGQEYHRALPDTLDHVFMGEAEESFREFLSRCKTEMPPTEIPGVTYMTADGLQLIPGRALANMNDSPTPNYDDFFFEKERLERETGKVFNIEYLPFESSRGCWWGQKNHCVFCGLNKELMSFREKDTDRVIRDIVTLSSKYRVVHLTAADWIVSHKTRAELFRRLADLDLDIECFYETRADLSKEELATMKKAGVVTVQPGIESFSTELLQLMKKGTTRLRHVQFLRWAKEWGIHLSYNILGGFPGEKTEWYLDMAAFLPTIYHLQPPLHNLHWVEMHRFSPLFQRRAELGVDEYQIREDYSFNFPPGLVDFQKVGYFFSFKASSLVDREAYAPCVRDVVGRWMEAHETRHPPEYHYIIGPGFLRINDTRAGRERYLHLAGLHQDVVLLADKIIGMTTLKDLLGPLYSAETVDGTLERVVDELLQEEVLMREGNSLLTLPIGRTPRTTEQLYSYVLGEHAPSRVSGKPKPPQLAVLAS